MKHSKRTGLILILTTFALAVQVGAAVKIETPKGGWRNSTNTDRTFTQVVNYPAVSVNTENVKNQATLIRGQIIGTRKTNDPARLIVNGVAMPIRVEDDGKFSRPYAFGTGSNGVEVRSPDGREKARLQFYEANPTVVQPKLSVVLSWDTDQTDLDLHVVSPDGQHVWYGNRVSANGGALDVDVTTGYGPEIFSTPTPVKGTYLVYVNYYGSGKREDMTLAQITVIVNGNSLDERKEAFSVPMRKAGELTLMHTFTVQ